MGFLLNSRQPPPEDFEALVSDFYFLIRFLQEAEEQNDPLWNSYVKIPFNKFHVSWYPQIFGRIFEPLRVNSNLKKHNPMKKMNPVVHFEMPARDRKRMADFYSTVFGWQTQMMGEEMGNYVTVSTTETEDGRPKMPGAINGGFYPRRDVADDGPSVVIAVDDIKQSAKDVAQAGGNVLGEPMEIPGVGSYVSFIDPEGNRVSLLQPIMR